MNSIEWIEQKTKFDGFTNFDHRNTKFIYKKTNFNTRAIISIKPFDHDKRLLSLSLDLGIDVRSVSVEVLNETDTCKSDKYTKNLGWLHWIQMIVYMPDGGFRSAGATDYKKYKINDPTELKKDYEKIFLPWIQERMDYDFIVDLIANGDRKVISTIEKIKSRKPSLWSVFKSNPVIPDDEDGLSFKRGSPGQDLILGALMYSNGEKAAAMPYLEKYQAAMRPPY